MEREIFFSGIGGQGVQLAARTLALAAVAEGREVLSFGTYGGSMRGGPTDATIVIGDGPILSSPIVDNAGAILLMHHHSWPELKPKMRDGATIVVDISVFRGEVDFPGGHIVPIDATGHATELGIQRAGAMLALGAFAAVTGAVALATLLEVARSVLPSYRSQHIEANDRAIRAGHALIAQALAGVPA